MKISIITLFPNMIKAFFEESIVKRAQKNRFVEIEIVNLRDFSINKRGTVDDRPYGGGAGMILRVDCLKAAIDSIKNKFADSKYKTILTSPRGKIYNQELARDYAKLEHLIIIAGHYEGVDERIFDYIDEEISIGDYIITGGELAACVITDSVVRIIKGVLKKKNASTEESFFSIPIEKALSIIGPDKKLIELSRKKKKKIILLEYPHFTRPQVFENKSVPDVLLSGNHKAIYEWRIKEAFNRTKKIRPDLLV